MSKVKIEILGGLGEVGMNSMLISYENTKFIIDCGIMSSNQPLLGADAFFPNINHLKSQTIDALVLTHAHEDHIGAIKFYLDTIDIKKIFCTNFTFELARKKLNSYYKSLELFSVVKDKEEFELGVFRLSFYKNTHSIVESSLIKISTPVGDILHSGDFKLDKTSYADTSFSDTGLKQLAKPLLLMSDSTNSEKQGLSKSEMDVYYGFQKIIKQHETSQIFITCFASNVHRMKMLIDIAEQEARSLVLVGRSLWNFYDLAIRNHYISTKAMEPFYPENAKNLNNAIFICTGSQGEYQAAIAKILRGEWQYIKIKEGDAFIHSALKIPGNEINIRYLLNTIAKQGAKIYHQASDDVHASGHAYQEEQKHFVKSLQPKYFLPIHGDYMMLKQHIENINSLNLPIESHLALDGDSLYLDENSFQKVGAQEERAKLWFKSSYVADTADQGLRIRKKIAREGLLLLTGKFEEKVFLIPPRLDMVGYDIAEKDLELMRKNIIQKMQAGQWSLENLRANLQREALDIIGWKPEVLILVD